MQEAPKDYVSQASALLKEAGEFDERDVARVGFLEATGEASIRAEVINKRLDERSANARELRDVVEVTFTKSFPPHGDFKPFVEVIPTPRIDVVGPESWRLSVLRVSLEDGLPIESVISGQATDRMLVIVERPKAIVIPDLAGMDLESETYADVRVVTVPHGTRAGDLRVASQSFGDTVKAGDIRCPDLITQHDDSRVYLSKVLKDEDLTLDVFGQFVKGLEALEQEYTLEVTQLARERRDRLEEKIVEVTKGSDKLATVVAAIGPLKG